MCAKYIGSPYGTLNGKFNGTVGVQWKGINVMRVLRVPANPGSIIKYQQYKDGIIPPEQFSFPQFNVRRLVINPLYKIASDALSDWIKLIWSPLADSKHLKMSGMNYMLHRNIANLKASIPNIDQEYDPATNAPDLSVLKVSDGDLEETSEMTAVYDPDDGSIKLDWDPAHYRNGTDLDVPYAMVLKKPLLDSYGRDGNWQPALTIYAPRYVLLDDGEPPTVQTRASGTGYIYIDEDLEASDLTTYLFFYNLEDYSLSCGANCTEAP